MKEENLWHQLQSEVSIFQKHRASGGQPETSLVHRRVWAKTTTVLSNEKSTSCSCLWLFLWHVHDSVTINYWTGGRDIILYHELLIRNHICPSARFLNSSNQRNVYIFSPSVFIISCFIVDVICLRKFASQTLDFHLFMFDQHFFFKEKNERIKSWSQNAIYFITVGFKIR